MVGLQFSFCVTLRRPEALDYIPMAREPQRLPSALSAQEVAYGAGLSASKVVALKLGDIPSRAHADPGGAGQGAA